MANRYLDAEERLEAQKRFYREQNLREWKRELDARPDPAFCYFIRTSENGRIKIGYSKRPSRRLYELRRQTPHKLELLVTVRGGADRESYYHRLFADHHRGGEWFDPHPDILVEIESLRENAGVAAFCDPMTRRALGGHNEDQQCAVLEARETLRRTA